jgi:EpsI family protein
MLPSPSLSRHVRAAVIVAAALLVASGVGFRALDEYLERPNGGTPLPAGTLARLPLQIGTWQGQEVPIDAALRRATDTDDLINRQYRRTSDGALVSLYVAYGIRARDLMPHRPEVCYPGAGWTFRSSDDRQLALPSGHSLAGRVLRFAHGTFDQRQIVVVNYYIVDGQYCPDVSLLRSKAWHGSRGVRYMVQAQITATSDAYADLDAGEAGALAFAVESADAIQAVLAAALAEAGPTGSRVSPDITGGSR